jgi:hypothetical protein
VAFSPDGRLLASGSLDATIKLWEVASGREVRTLSGHTGGVTSVAFSPDGRLLASGSLDATIKLWEVASGREVRTLSGHTGGVTSVAFSPDGRLLASGSGDRTIKLWEVTSGSLVRTLTGHTDWVYSVAFSPDGRLLASGSGDTTITLWEWQEAPITAVVIVWESRFPYDSSNRVINFVQLVSWAGRCAVLDNVDIFNKTGYSANNFEVVLDGSYTLVRYYTDPRYPAAFDVQKDGGVTIFRWRFRREVPSGSFAHLGLWVAECDLRIKAMLWTKDERIIGKLPASSVRLGPTGQVEVVNNLDERIEIANVKFVQVNIPIPLPALNAQQLPPQLQQQGVNLQPVPNLPPVVPINPGMAAPLPGVNVGPGGCPPEPNDDFKTASPITLPFFARCEINPDGENDFFMFRLDSYYRVTVDVAAERIGSKLDAILILWDERGRDIAYNDDYKGSDPFLSLGLAPGIYYIQVAPHGGHGAGPYELRVQAER